MIKFVRYLYSFQQYSFGLNEGNKNTHAVKKQFQLLYI